MTTGFLCPPCIRSSVVEMGVLDKAKEISGLGTGEEEEPPPYVCLACETRFDVQHHRCPECGSFDVRCSKWIDE